MKIYKRALITMLLGILGAPFAGVVVVIVGGFFIDDYTTLIWVGAGVCALILLITLFGERITFTLSETGQLSYYKGKKLVNQFEIPDCYVGYRRKSTGAADHDISLHISPVGGEETVCIDASPLGQNRFERLFAELERFAANETQVLRAQSQPDVQ